MKILKIFLLVLLLSSLSFAQKIGIWKNYANLQKINDSFVTDKGIWAVSSGGAFYYNFEDGSFFTLNKAEGLSANLLTAITIDKDEKVWLGSQDGNIDVYNPQTKTIKRILDIYTSEKINKSINCLAVSGDTIFVSSDLGLSLISSKTLSFIDTFRKFGPLSAEAKVISSLQDGLIYVATDNGIAIQKPGANNLSAPESWAGYNDLNGLPSKIVNKIVKYHDSLFVGTSKGLALYLGGKITSLTALFGNINIMDMVVKNDSLFFISPNQIGVYSKGKVSFPFQAFPYKKFSKINSGNLYASTDNGVVELNGFKITNTIVPNGPKANLFADMEIDNSGKLYIAAGGRDLYQLGYSMFDGTQWNNYNKSNNPSLFDDNINRIYIAPDQAVYLGTWGGGFSRIRNNQVTNFTAFNTSLVGIPKNLQFLVVLGMAADSKGNLWITNFQSALKQPLSRLSPDSVWTHYTNQIDNNVIQVWTLTIDNNDTKWFTVSSTESPAGQYLYYFNENRSLYSSDKDGWGVISSSDGLTNGAINAVVTDRRGELWIGTSNGITIISNPADPKHSISSVYLLKAQNIRCIAVDALNQKWVGTDKGVFVMSSDGTTLISNYTSGNSPLPADVITSIAVDNTTGTAYIGSDVGLTSVTTTSLNPQESMDNMFAYPNPVILDKTNPVTINIKGLVRDSDIKVLSISGNLVANFTSPGAGLAAWDGKDMNGKYVSSGVYLIVAYDKDGSNVGSTKIAVIRK